MIHEIKVNAKIPSFLVHDHKGLKVTDRSFIGIPSVLFFYPEQDLSGFLSEATAFKEQMSQFDKRKTLIVGISASTPDALKTLINKHKFLFTLLSDETKEMSRSFGVLHEDKIVRSTFVLDNKGVIKWIEKPVALEGHVGRVLAAVQEHCRLDIVRFEDYQRDYQEFMKTSLKPGQSEKKLKKEIMRKYGLTDKNK